VFLLEKWYGDVVTAQGEGAIVYAARLRCGPLRIGYGATLVLTGGDGWTPIEQATVRRVQLPRLESELATWSNVALRADARWWRDAAPIECCLIDGPDGAMHWRCHMPRAVARVQIGSAVCRGLGYVEQLQLSIPPWKLPFRGGALRWGRYLSAQHTIVWIEWTGANPRQWVWLDGVPQTSLASLDGGRRLVFQESRAIRDQPLITTIRSALPKLGRRLADDLGAACEHKRLSRAVLVNGAGSVDEGWAIHEEVLW
jgi:hypothetical protein